MTGVITTIPKFQFSDANGLPLALGTVTTYVTNSTTPTTTWQNQALSSANTNPIQLDDNGECVIWLDPAVVYRFVLKSATGSTIWTVDNISGPLPALDVNNFITSLSASSGSNLVGFIQSGAGAVARTEQDKLREIVSTKDFGAVANGSTNDTASVTAAYAAAKVLGAELVFPAGAHAVTTVTFDGSDVFVRFAGNARLKGIAAVSTAAVLQITCRQMVAYNLQVDANFNSNYSKGAVWWNSTDSENPAQGNTIFGFKISNTVNGLVYGDVIGGSPVNAAQSENTIFGLKFRATQVCLVGNQPNGFLTLASPILDCNPNEWVSQPGYNATTYATNALCFNNPAAGSNHLLIIGGEILKTFNVLGYGFNGWATISSPNVMEIAGTQGYVDGPLSITDSLNGAMTCGGISTSTLPAFVVDPGFSALYTIYLRNYALTRPAASSVNSTASFIAAASGTPAGNVVIRDCKLYEWRWDATVPLVSGVTLGYFDNTFITVGTGSNPTVKFQKAPGIATTYTVLPGDYYLIANNSGTTTVTMPDPAANEGRVLKFLNLAAYTVVSASSNIIPLGGTVTGTAMLAASAGAWAEYQSDGSSWRTMAGN